MKRIFFLALTLIMLLTITGCSCSACKGESVLKPDAAYFLLDYKQNGVTNVDEKATYEVTFKNNDQSSENGITPHVSLGKFETHLTTEKIGETNYYKFTSTYFLQGDYTYERDGVQSVKPFNDTIVSTVWFLGKNNNFKPYKTEKSVKTTTAIANYETDASSLITFENYDFSFVIDYSGANAKIDYTDNIENLNLKDKTIKKYYDTNFCDNDFLIFFPRLIKFSKTFASTIKTISTGGLVDLNMRLSKYNTTMDLTDAYKINNKELKAKVDVVEYNLVGEFPGPAVKVYSASLKDDNSLFKAPIRIEKFVTLVGWQEFTLKSFVHNEA